VSPFRDIRPLAPESPEYQATYTVRYQTSGYWDLSVREGAQSAAFSLRLRRFSAPVEKTFDFTLAPAYFRPCEVLGIYENGVLAGLIEIHGEDWNSRMRITELLVFEPFRGKGLGGELLEAAKAKAKAAGCRGMVLETQSCNVAAIACYQKHGFRFIGLDATCYTNDDIGKREIRLEMGLEFPEKEGKETC